MKYADFYQRSIATPEAFWHDEAALIDWNTPFSQVLDYSQPPFARWFVGGKTNLCHNAVDRWCTTQGDKPALIAISTETNTERSYSFNQLHVEVQRWAAMMQSQGRPRADLHADDRRSCIRHAGLRPHRRGALGGVRRFCRQQPGQPHR
jgi:propionyl-CoA synthetase